MPLLIIIGAGAVLIMVTIPQLTGLMMSRQRGYHYHRGRHHTPRHPSATPALPAWEHERIAGHPVPPHLRAGAPSPLRRERAGADPEENERIH